MVGEVLIGAHDIQVGGHFVDRLGAGGFWFRDGGSVSVMDIVRLLVSGLVGFDGCAPFRSRMVPGGTFDSVADETFIVLDVFGSLDQGEIDPVDVHGHRIPGIFPGSCGGGNVVGSSS